MKYLLMIPLLLAASPAPGAEFTVLRPQQSSITFVSKQMGVPVEGNFRKFAARIAVDPARLESGSAHIDIDLASIDTGIAEADVEVAGKAWFDTKNHPVASFVSGSVKPSGKDRHEVLGKLSIKGRSLDVKAPFTLKQNADTLIIDGTFRSSGSITASARVSGATPIRSPMKYRSASTLPLQINNHFERKTP